MAGYSEPRIFRSNRQGQFTKFMHGITATSFEDHLDSEITRLSPIFDVVSNTLQPHGIKPSYQARLSPKNIGGAFAGTAHGNGFLTFGMPIIIPEQNFIYPTQKQVYVDNTYGDNITKHLKPDSYKRMFWTSAFGLLAVKNAATPYADSKTYIFPTNTVPQEFLDIEDIDPVIKAAAKLSALVNHDYFHQIIYCGISTDFGHRNSESPLNKHYLNSTTKLEGALFGNKLDNQFKVRAWDIEPWAMRFHTQVMQQMVSTSGNALELAAEELCGAIESCPALLKAQGTMSTPPISPQDYATRLLAFSLIRSTPLDHPFTQECIEKVKIALRASNNPSSKGVDEIFDHIYQTNFKEVLFGKNGKEFEPEECSKRTKQLSAHSIVLAQRDCEQAFRLLAEYEAAAANDNSPRARRLRLQKHKGTIVSYGGFDVRYGGLEVNF